MRFFYFKQLSAPQQAHLICHQGILLAERTEDGYVVALYALFDFYVEVHHRFNDSEIVLITSFYNTSLLEPYLAEISLQRLLQPVLYQ